MNVSPFLFFFCSLLSSGDVQRRRRRGREAHRQAGGCAIDVITHLAEGERWSVTVNNQAALHQRAHFPPLGLFLCSRWVGCRRKQETSVRFIVRTQRRLDFARVLRWFAEKTSGKIGSTGSRRLKTEALQRCIFLMVLKWCKQSSEHRHINQLKASVHPPR